MDVEDCAFYQHGESQHIIIHILCYIKMTKSEDLAELKFCNVQYFQISDLLYGW